MEPHLCNTNNKKLKNLNKHMQNKNKIIACQKGVIYRQFSLKNAVMLKLYFLHQSVITPTCFNLS